MAVFFREEHAHLETKMEQEEAKMEQEEAKMEQQRQAIERQRQEKRDAAGAATRGD